MSQPPSPATADLSDAHEGTLQVAEPVFRDYGGRLAFHGLVRTVKVFEDNSLVKAELGTSGEGRVLVVDGGGSTRCALLGDNLAAMAAKNGWAGLIIHGAIRDAAIVGTISLGVKALATCPVRSIKRGIGEVGVPVAFAGLRLQDGDQVCADQDGIVAPRDGTQLEV